MTIRKNIEDRIGAGDINNDFREIAGAANLRSVLDGRISAPACYVFRLRNNPGKNDLDNGVSQRVAESYAVVVVTSNQRDARGGDSSDANEAFCSQISTALLGWEPDIDADPLEYSGGQLVTMKDGYFFWQDTYTTVRFRRAL